MEEFFHLLSKELKLQVMQFLNKDLFLHEHSPFTMIQKAELSMIFKHTRHKIF